LYTMLKQEEKQPKQTATGSNEMESGLIRNEEKNEDIAQLNQHWRQDDHASISCTSPRALGTDPVRKEIMKKVSSHAKLAGNEALANATGSGQADPTATGAGRPSMIRAMTLNFAMFAEGLSAVDKLPKNTKRILGIAGAAVAGIFFGTNFDPPQYLMDHSDDKDPQALDYVYSHFCGVFLTSSIYFLIYCQVKEEPIINPRIVVPGFISGIMWAIADTSWFYANSKLSLSVAFPLITSGPGFVAAMWGIFVYSEYSGTRNYTILAVAFMLTVSSDVMIAMSS